MSMASTFSSSIHGGGAPKGRRGSGAAFPHRPGLRPAHFPHKCGKKDPTAMTLVGMTNNNA
jgi:hypothetical protein